MNIKRVCQNIMQACSSYRTSGPIIAAIGVSIVVGLAMLFSSVRRDEKMLGFIVGHVASLVESQDRPELQRLLRSASLEEGQLIVVEGSIIFGSSISVSDLDQPYRDARGFPVSDHALISGKGLMTVLPIIRENGRPIPGAKIVMITPLFNLLIWSIGMAFLVLNIGLLIGSKWADTLSEKRAKELSAESYKRLIHDLHNPIAALRMSSRLSVSPLLSDEEKREASENVPILAEQILNQVCSANENLNFENAIIRLDDVRDCVKGAADEARLASQKLSSINVITRIPTYTVIIPHDGRLLRRAISNLVKNALDACRTEVKVALERVENEITILVEDDGPGLTQEQAALYLLGRGRSTKGDRRARGLAATNHIAHAHGGRIVYRPSALGGGCFEIRLSGVNRGS